MPRDLVDVVRGLRKDDGASMRELETAVVELGRRVQRLQEEVDEMRAELKSRTRKAPRRQP